MKKHISPLFNFCDCPHKIISKEQFEIIMNTIILNKKWFPCEDFSKNHCFILTQTKILPTNI